jgi:hypothetical protein
MVGLGILDWLKLGAGAALVVSAQPISTANMKGASRLPWMA